MPLPRDLQRQLGVLGILLCPVQAFAISVGIPSIDDLISPALQKEAARLTGVLSAHRPYQAATPLGTTLGVESFLELTLIQVPQGLLDELANVGLSGSLPLRSLPMAKLHFHKGLLPRLDFGASYLAFMGYSIYGADLKWAISVPDEGPSWAVRLAYSQSSLSYLSCKSWSPQLLVSRKLNFADPYLGLEYTWITGRIRGSQTRDLGPPVGSVTVEVDVPGIKSWSASAFMGVGLRIPVIGVKMTLEGSYSFVGAHTLGVALGTSW